MPRDARFWRNVTIIAVAHVTIIIGLVRWNRETRKASLQSIVWMGGEIAAATPPSPIERTVEATSPPEVSTPDQENEASRQTPVPSDIQLPASTPSPTPVA